MLTKLFSKPLSLTIGGQQVNFQSLKEFEFSLVGRTDVPARKISSLILLSLDELMKEAEQIKSMEQRFVEILSRALEAPGSIGNAMREIDPHVFSQDHHWRDVMVALRDKGSDYDELRRIALVKYMQYLTSRQEVIKHTYVLKKQTASAGRDNSAPAAAMPPPAFEPEATMMADAGMRETVILDSVVLAPEPKKTEEFARLPKGEAIILSFQHGLSIDVMLSKHAYKLKCNDDFKFVDEHGTVYKLQDGKNLIGRDDVCNVIVDTSLRDVSRLHLIIERLGPDTLRLTDLSSHGTFIPARLLPST